MRTLRNGAPSTAGWGIGTATRDAAVRIGRAQQEHAASLSGKKFVNGSRFSLNQASKHTVGCLLAWNHFVYFNLVFMDSSITSRELCGKTLCKSRLMNPSPAHSPQINQDRKQFIKTL